MSPTPAFSPWEPGVVSLAMYWLLVLGLTGVLLLLSSRLGVHRPDPEKARAYESGVIPTGPAQLHRPVPFFLVAMFFLVFDVETAFLVLWAVAYDRLGWAGLVHIGVFAGVLLVGLGYLWRKGGLDWAASRAGGNSP